MANTVRETERETATLPTVRTCISFLVASTALRAHHASISGVRASASKCLGAMHLFSGRVGFCLFHANKRLIGSGEVPLLDLADTLSCARAPAQQVH